MIDQLEVLSTLDSKIISDKKGQEVIHIIFRSDNMYLVFFEQTKFAIVRCSSYIARVLYLNQDIMLY